MLVVSTANGKADATMAKTMERWDGMLGTMMRDGAQWRIDWADGTSYYLDTELATCLRHGSIREV
jgi:hypothetical protein